MAHIKLFWIPVILIYLFMSLPGMLGIGYVIDWVPEATPFQKFNGYILGGLVENFSIKLIVSVIAGVVVYWYMKYKQLHSTG